MNLDRFELYLLAQDRKRSTVLHHLKNLRILEGRLGRLNDLTIADLDDLVLSMRREGKAGSYINHLIKTLRVYYRFLANDTFEYYPLLKERAKAKATMSDEEIEAFLKLPPTRNGQKETNNYATWTMFFRIMAYSGMRTGEVAHLTVDDIDFGRGVFVLSDTKTNEPRLVPIAQPLVKPLTEFLKTRDKFLFPSKRGGNKDGHGPVVDNVDWHYNFHTRIKRLGIKRANLTPYSLRHSFITSMLNEDVDIFKVQKIVGHRRIDTTARYRHLTTKDITLAIAKLSLVKRNADPQSTIDATEKQLQDLFGQDKRFRTSYKKDKNGKLTFEVEVADKPADDESKHS